MKKEKTYEYTRFNAESLREAVSVYDKRISSESYEIDSPSISLITENGNSKWTHDTEEEFFASYRQLPYYALYGKAYYGDGLEICMTAHGEKTRVEVSFPDRESIHAVFDVFEKHHNAAKISPPVQKPKPKPKPKIFVGHGGDPQWRDLKDHLHDKHNIDIEAYEIGARAGHAIRDILEDMLTKSSFAILIMTGEDETADGKFRARQNVIHEVGLFQGKLGFSRAIVLLEEGAEEFSNIKGIEQIRFSKGNIKETFGDVLATIKREFPKSNV